MSGPSAQQPAAQRLLERRMVLVQRSAALRARLERDAEGLQPVFSAADRLQDAWYWLRANPLAVAAGAVVLAAWRPRRAWRLGWGAWSAWKLLQRVRAAAPLVGRLRP